MIANPAPSTTESNLGPGEGLTSPAKRRLELGLDGGLAGLDPAGAVVWINPTLANWLNFGMESAVGRSLADALKGQAPQCAAALQEFLGGTQTWQQHQLPGGEGAWFNMELARNSAGVHFRLSSNLPATEELVESGWDESYGSPGGNRQMFVRLVRAETQLNNLMQRWPGVIFSQRADFSIRYASARILELTGVPESEWSNAPQRFWQVVHEADAEALRRQCEAAVKTAGGVSITYRLRNLQTNQIAYVLEHREAVTSKTGLVLGYECLWLDITRQTIAEKRLSSAAWKDTLATLTMGLAHDFGNIMSGILSLSELYQAQTQPDHPFHEGLGLIKQQSLQASNLIHRIVNLHRDKTGERSYHDLNQLVNELTDLVRTVLPRRIRVVTELSASSLPVYVDSVEFRQVMLNLGLNAGDAMPQRGTLTLRTRRVTEPQTFTHGQGRFPGLPAVCVEVQDSGTGIPERNLPFLFDPFFTTKPVNKGSGLGLYNARVFVEKHAGAISVETVEGQGTTFRLWLPEADFTERERAQAVPESRRKVLLVVGSAGRPMESVTEVLRQNDFYVMATSSPVHFRELLAEEATVDAVLLLADPGEPQWIKLMAELPDLRASAKLVVQLVGTHSDLVDATALGKMHLVLSSDTSEGEFLQRLKGLLDKSPHL